MERRYELRLEQMLAQAEVSPERMQNLFKEGAVSQRDVENAEVSLRAAESGEEKRFYAK